MHRSAWTSTFLCTGANSVCKAVLEIIRNAATPGYGAPGCNVKQELDEPLFNHLTNTIHLMGTDAASDEHVAALQMLQNSIESNVFRDFCRWIPTKSEDRDERQDACTTEDWNALQMSSVCFAVMRAQHDRVFFLHHVNV